jgi:hypothetical protein
MVWPPSNVVAVQPNTSPGSGCPVVSRARMVVSREADKFRDFSHPAVELEAAWKGGLVGG